MTGNKRDWPGPLKMFGAINNNKLNKLTAPLETSLQDVLQQQEVQMQL